MRRLTLTVQNKIIPLADRVLVKRLVAKAQVLISAVYEVQTATGILLPETSVAKANQGNVIAEHGMVMAQVIAVGPGRMDNNGKLLPMNCKVGDRVLLPEYGGTPLKMGEEEYTLFCDCDILGKFE